MAAASRNCRELQHQVWLLPCRTRLLQYLETGVPGRISAAQLGAVSSLLGAAMRGRLLPNFWDGVRNWELFSIDPEGRRIEGYRWGGPGVNCMREGVRHCSFKGRSVNIEYWELPVVRLWMPSGAEIAIRASLTDDWRSAPVCPPQFHLPFARLEIDFWALGGCGDIEWMMSLILDICSMHFQSKQLARPWPCRATAARLPVQEPVPKVVIVHLCMGKGMDLALAAGMLQSMVQLAKGSACCGFYRYFENKMLDAIECLTSHVYDWKAEPSQRPMLLVGISHRGVDGSDRPFDLGGPLHVPPDMEQLAKIQFQRQRERKDTEEDGW